MHACRRIEFLTQEGFPCLILARDDYGKACTSRRRSRSLLLQKLRHHHISDLSAVGSSSSSSSSGSLTEQVQQLLQQDQKLEPVFAWDMQQQEHKAAGPTTTNSVSAAFSHRQLQQAGSCPTARGSVLVLAPYLRENLCAFGDEAPDIAQLFSAAGYNVIFKCNDPGLCPAGPPILDDYEGWSKHAFVVVSSIGDDNAAGDTPIIMSGASLDFQNTNHIVSGDFLHKLLDS
jgi:hypothetical protein